MYSGNLSMSSLTFIRPNANSSGYYYQTINVTVSVTGTYTFSSSSTIDIYGCLYNSSFDPSYPDLWLAPDNDLGGDGQFLISYNLEHMRSYILLVTTFQPNVTGPYLIRTTGPAQLNLSSVSGSTNSPSGTSSKYAIFLHLHY